MYGWMAGWLDGCMDGGWMDGWLAGWMADCMIVMFGWIGSFMSFLAVFQSSQHDRNVNMTVCAMKCYLASKISLKLDLV